MTEQETHSNQAADLRREAEKIARGNAYQSPENMLALSHEETRHVLHELRVHQIELELVPHPKLSHPKAIEADYGMSRGVLRVLTRAAVAGYALGRWSVDCSPKHSLDSSRHHLWLRNPRVLSGVESAVLAPGFSEKALS